uniref:Uncharacterized protein n=1 Tax=Opuntia streptacantha TaxID=393608 RepID=A0A7C8YQJ7_OPUST
MVVRRMLWREVANGSLTMVAPLVFLHGESFGLRCLVCTNGKVAIPCPQSSGYFPKSLLSIQGKCCAIVDWCICQCHIYMARGLLALSLHLFSRSERSSTFNLIVTSIGTRLETLVQRRICIIHIL